MAEDAAEPGSRKAPQNIKKPAGVEQRRPAFSMRQNLDAAGREAPPLLFHPPWTLVVSQLRTSAATVRERLNTHAEIALKYDYD